MTISEIEKGIKDCLDTINKLRDDLASAERERAHQQGRAERYLMLYTASCERRKQLQAENALLREAMRDLLADREAWRIARDARDRAKATLGEKE